MKKTIENLVTLLIFVACLFPSSLRAGPITLSEFGSRETSLGNAGAALYDSPSVIFFNPANIARQKGLNLQLGVSTIAPRWKYSTIDNTYSATSEKCLGYPPHLAVSYLLGNAGFGDIAAGLGVFVPYGSSFSWPSDWVGREQIQRIGLLVYEISPTIAIRPKHWLAIGASFRYLPASVYQKQAVRLPGSPEGEVELGGNGSAMGAAAGVSLFPDEKLSIALSWRSRATLKFTGQSNFSNFEPPFDSSVADRDVKTEIPLAQIIRFGIAYQITPRWLVTSDLEYQFWNTLKEVKISFNNSDGTEDYSISPRNCNNSISFHFGTEYKIYQNILVRVGYNYDQKANPEQTVLPAPPDSDKHIISLGASYLWGPYNIAAHFEDAIFATRTSRTSPMPGQWKGGWLGNSEAFIFGLSLGAHWDVAPAISRTALVADAAND